jgi:hypothetical protein
MVSMIPAFVAPTLQAVSRAISDLGSPQPAGWVVMVISIGLIGAILRRHRAEHRTVG